MAKRGRPTQYREEYCQTILEYFDQPPYEDVKIPHYKNGEVVWEDIKRMPAKLPTLVGFAKHIGVCYSTVYNWQDEEGASFQPEFLQAFTRAKELQKDFLVQNGLQGLYNPLFAKFTAINLTDMVDRSEVNNNNKTDFTLKLDDKTEKLLDKFLSSLKAKI